MRKTLPAFLAVLGALGPSGCIVNLSLGESVQMTCQSDAGCPAGWLCSAQLGLCVAPDGGDAEPPAVVSFDPCPTALTADQACTLTFTVNEPLSYDPEVSFVTSAAESAFGLVDHVDDVYSFRYDHESGALAGTWPVRVRLVDLSGNEATASLGDIVLQ